MAGSLTDAGEPPLVAVLGPTAAGKTAVGIALAERLNGEIVSADAVAVYRGLDIGAAKPTAVERRQTVFHLIDAAAPDEDFTLADFESKAGRAIADIRKKGRTPILAGGTGLYARAATANLTIPNVPPQPEFRARLYAEAEEFGSALLHSRLESVDSASAAKISPADAKRIIRALEVYEVTGRPASSFHTPEGVQGVLKPNTFLFALNLDRAALYRRIDDRVDAMMAAGFLDEVRGLLAAGCGPDLKAMQSLGYRHLVRHLSGESPLELTIEELKRDTRRYAKRQISWFSGDARIRWIDVTTDSQAEAAAVEIERLLNEAGAFSAERKEATNEQTAGKPSGHVPEPGA